MSSMDGTYEIAPRNMSEEASPSFESSPSAGWRVTYHAMGVSPW